MRIFHVHQKFNFGECGFFHVHQKFKFGEWGKSCEMQCNSCGKLVIHNFSHVHQKFNFGECEFFTFTKNSILVNADFFTFTKNSNLVNGGKVVKCIVTVVEKL